MAESNEKEPESQSEDKELDELLNSALEDLTRPPTVKETKSDEQKEEIIDTEENETTLDELSNQWNDEIKKLAANYESTMESLFGQLAQGESVSSEDVSTSIQKLAEAASHVLVETEGSDDVTSTIAETLRSLSQGAEAAQQTDLSEEHLANMFSTMGLSEDGASNMIHGMMQALLSKEVLYPSLKEITDKYPLWLEENRTKLDDAQFERYSKQSALMKTVCDELEQENDTDSEEVKKERTVRVLGLMQHLESMGQPPTDLVGVRTNTPIDPQACSVM